MVDLLSGDFIANPLLNIGAGLLSEAGPSFQPRNFGRGLLTGLQSASQAQRGALANQLARQQLTLRAREADARQRLAGLLMPVQGAGRIGPTQAAAARLEAGAAPASALGGDDTAQMLGLLAQVAPEQFAQGLLGQVFPSERAEPADIRSLRAVGIDPASDQGRQIIIDRLTRQGGTLEELDGIFKALSIEKIRQELADDDRTDLEDQRASEVSLLNTINAVTEMAELNEQLEGTLGETGVPFADARRAGLAGGGALGRITGLGGGELTDLAAKLDRFEKLSTQEVIRAAEEARIRGALTNNQLQAFQAAKPGTGVAPEANRQILADMLELSLSAADAQGVTVRDRDKKERLIRELRNIEPEIIPPSEVNEGRRTMEDVLSDLTGRRGTRRPPAGAEAERIGDMTDEQLLRDLGFR